MSELLKVIQKTIGRNINLLKEKKIVSVGQIGWLSFLGFWGLYISANPRVETYQKNELNLEAK